MNIVDFERALIIEHNAILRVRDGMLQDAKSHLAEAYEKLKIVEDKVRKYRELYLSALNWYASKCHYCPALNVTLSPSEWLDFECMGLSGNQKCISVIRAHFERGWYIDGKSGIKTKQKFYAQKIRG